MSIKLFDLDSQTYAQHDGGQTTQSTLLLAILAELKVHSVFLQAMNINVINDDLQQMRLDATQDPGSITSYP